MLEAVTFGTVLEKWGGDSFAFCVWRVLQLRLSRNLNIDAGCATAFLSQECPKPESCTLHGHPTMRHPRCIFRRFVLRMSHTCNLLHSQPTLLQHPTYCDAVQCCAKQSRWTLCACVSGAVQAESMRAPLSAEGSFQYGAYSNRCVRAFEVRDALNVCE